MIASAQPILELRTNASKALVCLAMSVGWLIAGPLFIGKGRIITVIVGIVMVTFGLVGVPTCLGFLFSRRFALRLTPEGFAYGGLRKRYFYKWSTIAAFGVGTVDVRRVCFTLRPDYHGEEKVRAINQASIGFDKFLPDSYGKKPLELARLLEEWRRRYSS